MPHDVVTLGEAMALFLADPGTPLTSAHRFTRQVAGAESNVAVGLARLGCSVAWIGRVGDDAFGRAVVRELRGEGVDVGAVVVDPLRPTGLLARDAHAHRPVEVVYGRAGSAGANLEPGDVPAALVTSARLLHLTGITPVLSASAAAAVWRAADLAAEQGVAISFDPNLRRRLCPPARAVELLAPLAERARLILAGLDEAVVMSGRSTREDAASWFLERGAELVVLKSGAEGAWGTDGSTCWTCPAEPVPVVDPVGAGDAFNAGFLAGWLGGVPVPQALAQASLVAASVVAAHGDLAGLPTSAELTSLLGGAGVVRR